MYRIHAGIIICNEKGILHVPVLFHGCERFPHAGSRRRQAGGAVKIGVFGGTFNPVHLGHLINAQYLLGEYSLDRIVFVPAREPVHKPLEGGATAEDRFRMLELAVRGNGAFEVSRIELDRETPSYTVITLGEIGRRYGNDGIHLIIGADSYRQLDTWKDYRSILAEARVIVMRRPGEVIDKDLYPDREAFLFAANPLIDISSRGIRAAVRTGAPVRYLVPDGVLEYIKEKGLYAN